MAFRSIVNGKFVSRAVYESEIAANQAATLPPATLPQDMAALEPEKVKAMRGAIETALQSREGFESAKRPGYDMPDLIKARSSLSSDNVARFFTVLGVDPDTVLNRSRYAGLRANLKGMVKIAKIAKYVAGIHGNPNRVNLALFAATIIAANRGVDWISNSEQRQILSSVSPASFPQDLADAIRDYQHKFMTSGINSETSQFRTTFENIGAYTVSARDTAQGYQDGITVNMASPLIAYLNERWNLSNV